MNLPDKIFGIETKGAYERALASSKSEKPEEKPGIILPQSDIKDPENYVISRDGLLYIAKNKIYHNHNWNDTHKLLQENNRFMLTLPEMYDFIQQLKEGIEGLIEVHNVSNDIILIDELIKIYDEMLKIGNWRAEWLDARFEKRKDGLYVHYDHRIQQDDSLKPLKTEKLEDCVREDCYVDLSSFNKQGMPIKKLNVQSYVQGKNIYYWSLVNGKVARLFAVSAGAYLDCSRDPSGLDDRLGVRAKFFSSPKIR